MTSISNMPSVALAILQQLNAATAASPQQPSTVGDLIAVANGQTDKVAVSRQPTQAQAKVSEAMFSMSRDSIAKQKIDLIVSTGKALGVERDDYASMDDFVAAMKKVYGEIKVQPGGMAAIHGLEKELGLDKLGLSLEDVIGSAQDGDSNDKVTKALERRMGKNEDKKDNSEASQPAAVGLDQTGLYGLLSFY